MAASAPILVLLGGTKLQQKLIENRPLVIGSSRSAGFRLPHPVEPFHCEVIWIGQLVYLIPKASEFPITLNGRVIVQETVFNPGDQLVVGGFTLGLDWEDQDQTQLPPNSSPEEVIVSSSTALPDVTFGNRLVKEVRLRGDRIVMGGENADVDLQGVSTPQFEIVRNTKSGGYLVRDLGRTGNFVNGHNFGEKELVIGDILNTGRFFFSFDGAALIQKASAVGCQLAAEEVEVTGSQGKLILQDANLLIRPNQFAGLLGPSGAGKTTLLRALSGLTSVSSGHVRIDGKDIQDYDDLSDVVGVVPQHPIVHLELTAREALWYGALLRLPRRTPRNEIRKLIDELTSRVDLNEHLDTKAGNLSGGQLKKLSVCVELLKRPSLLFLDEPTSGLDPESETEVMRMLHQLAANGCTIIATTHMMDNVYLMNSIVVVMASRPNDHPRQPGTTIFQGRVREARNFFGVKNISEIYGRLKERPRNTWKEQFAEFQDAEQKPRSAAPPEAKTKETHKKQPKRFSLPILLRRYKTILSSDWKNLAIVACQPLFIALLIALVAVSFTDDTGFPEIPDKSFIKLFIGYIAVLWLGCSNGATAIVNEISVFRRENFVGLPASSYLISKFVGVGALTIFQSAVVYLVLKFFPNGLQGNWMLQVAGFMSSAIVSTGLGLVISSWSKSSLQAVMMVPIFIIPQILFSGAVVSSADWTRFPVPRLMSRVVPSFGSQRIMDSSFFYEQPVEGYTALMDKGLDSSSENLTTSLYPARALFQASSEFEFSDEGSTRFLSDDGKPVEDQKKVWNLDEDTPEMRLGHVYIDKRPMITGFLLHGIWTILCYLAALLILRKKTQESF